MSFFRGHDGTFYPIKDIVAMRYGGRSSGGQEIPATVRLRDRDDSITVDEDTIFEIRAAALLPLPAQPGFALLTYWPSTETPDQPYIENQPILGWRDLGDDGLKPVVLDNSNEVDADPYPSAILMPDGRVTDPYNGTWDDQAAWAAHAKDEVVRRAERVAARLAQAQ